MAITNSLTVDVGKTDMLEVVKLLLELGFTLGSHLFTFEQTTSGGIIMTRRTTDGEPFSSFQRGLKLHELKANLELNGTTDFDVTFDAGASVERNGNQIAKITLSMKNGKVPISRNSQYANNSEGNTANDLILFQCKILIIEFIGDDIIVTIPKNSMIMQFGDQEEPQVSPYNDVMDFKANKHGTYNDNTVLLEADKRNASEKNMLKRLENSHMVLSSSIKGSLVVITYDVNDDNTVNSTLIYSTLSYTADPTKSQEQNTLSYLDTALKEGNASVSSGTMRAVMERLSSGQSIVYLELPEINDDTTVEDAMKTIDALTLEPTNSYNDGATSSGKFALSAKLIGDVKGTGLKVDHAAGLVFDDISGARIEDADFAAETSNLTKSQILQQAATSMLAQANASKQSVLSLLQG